ncbi:hypothetical protein FACS1894170_09700 [Planctomycetales bacterium]|nr:hypothetical protein FACS1894170_09700 [Planctomycetales bacterium]
MAPYVKFFPELTDALLVTMAPGTPATVSKAGTLSEARSFLNSAVVSWTPSKDFGWLADGTSNQILMGEKHIPAWTKGKAETDRDSRYTAWDGGVLSIDTSKAMRNAAGALLYNPTRASDNAEIITVIHIATSTKEYATNDGAADGMSAADQVWWHIPRFAPQDIRANPGGASYLYGSSHAGVVNFLLGDGTVHGLPVSTNTWITYTLGNVSDGAVTSLP